MTLSQITIDLILSLVKSGVASDERLSKEVKSILESGPSEWLGSQFSDGGSLFEMMWYQATDKERKAIEKAIAILLEQSTPENLGLAEEGFIRLARATSRLYPNSLILSELVLQLGLFGRFSHLLPLLGKVPKEDQVPYLNSLVGNAVKATGDIRARCFEVVGEWLFEAVQANCNTVVSQLANPCFALAYTLSVDGLRRSLENVRIFQFTSDRWNESLSSLMLAHFLSTARYLIRNNNPAELVELLSRNLDQRLDSRLLPLFDAGFSWLGCIVLRNKLVPSLENQEQTEIVEEYLFDECSNLGKINGPNEFTHFAAHALEHATGKPLSQDDDEFNRRWEMYRVPLTVESVLPSSNHSLEN
jgi:hypothetical protein